MGQYWKSETGTEAGYHDRHDQQNVQPLYWCLSLSGALKNSKYCLLLLKYPFNYFYHSLFISTSYYSFFIHPYFYWLFSPLPCGNNIWVKLSFKKKNLINLIQFKLFYYYYYYYCKDWICIRPNIGLGYNPTSLNNKFVECGWKN